VNGVGGETSSSRLLGCKVIIGKSKKSGILGNIDIEVGKGVLMGMH